MKAILAGVTAALLLSATAAPSFAKSVSDPENCYFKDASLCQTESLSPTTSTQDEPAPAPVVVLN